MTRMGIIDSPDDPPRSYPATFVTMVDGTDGDVVITLENVAATGPRLGPSGPNREQRRAAKGRR